MDGTDGYRNRGVDIGDGIIIVIICSPISAESKSNRPDQLLHSEALFYSQFKSHPTMKHILPTVSCISLSCGV